MLCVSLCLKFSLFLLLCNASFDMIGRIIKICVETEGGMIFLLNPTLFSNLALFYEGWFYIFSMKEGGVKNVIANECPKPKSLETLKNATRQK